MILVNVINSLLHQFLVLKLTKNANVFAVVDKVE